MTPLPGRDQLVRDLADPSRAAAAASALLGRPEWLTAPPPRELLTALANLGFDSKSAIFALARAWDRAAMGEALWERFLTEAGAVREHFAWLLKNFASSTTWPQLVRHALSPDESLQTRVHLIQALDRLVFAEPGWGWPELDETLAALTADPAPEVRESAVGLLMSAAITDSRRETIAMLLVDPDERVVLSALNAVAQRRLAGAAIERALAILSKHASPSVRRLASGLNPSEL